MRTIELVPAVFRFPTPTPEADGTLSWEATTVVTCTARGAGCTGLGWTYSSSAAAGLITEHLADAVVADGAAGAADGDGASRSDTDVDIAGSFVRMRRACRNLGTRGLVMQAISAVDIALWDLRARLLDVPLVDLLGGRTGATVPVYGSGGFTTLSASELESQVQMWLTAGCSAIKVKIGEQWGRNERRDLARVAALARMTGDDVSLMVDANGAYGRAQARRVGSALDSLGVTWFEEPVSSDDLEGLRSIKAAVRCDVSAGEYISEPAQAATLSDVVDCLQLDVTRCGGYTGWLACAAVAEAAHVDISAHCAPALHAPLAGTVEHLRHLEWFIDHARLEPQLVDGVPAIHGGQISPSTAAGHGMSLSGRAAGFRMG